MRGALLAALASLGFAELCLALSRLSVDPMSLASAVRGLDQLWLVKSVAAALGLGFAGWSLSRRAPRWPGLSALAVAALAASLAFAIE
jgi:hypothetical protein